MESHEMESVQVEPNVQTLDNNALAEVVWSVLSTSTAFVILIFIVTCIRVLILGQKTRNPQQRRMYVGSRPRQSLTPQEPTIFVSPSNLPPPPKYECMAPPSYEEVVGIHYPNYQVQPITQPISAALNQGSSNTPPEITTSVVTVNETAPVAVTVTAESRSTSVTVARS